MREIEGRPDVCGEGAVVAEVVAECRRRLPDGVVVADFSAPHIVAEDVHRKFNGERQPVFNDHFLFVRRRRLRGIGVCVGHGDGGCREREGREASECLERIHRLFPLVVVISASFADTRLQARAVPACFGRENRGVCCRECAENVKKARRP